MLIKRTKERSQEITPDNRGVIWGKELNGMATDEELYGQYLSGDETGLELLIKKYGDPLTYTSMVICMMSTKRRT